MKAVLSVLLLAALTAAATALFWRKYIYVKEDMTWNDAEAYCKENYVDLAIIESKLDLERIEKVVTSFEPSWIGQSNISSVDNFPQWDDTGLLDFTSLYPEEHIKGNTCISIENYLLLTVKNLSDCAKRQTFVCYTWKPDLIVVPEKKTWEEALKYCRMNYTDLVSITTYRDYLLINSTVTEIQTSSFWTSLRFLGGSWYWVNQIYMDKENTGFLPSCPTPGFHCGSLKVETNVLENRNCEEKMHFICYKQNWQEYFGSNNRK
ncbi:putative C-type lectin domain family 20 member A [Tachysurus fulvidraco]|uniref:putative C-type lectin domain family 20 member A n=1 Tax=Tachysurus fulvidraco TaxID=1234273 RepID=UPI000F4FCBD0|nr:putative C-type lectin domain family 20 member A [Tachysurus fulvidraco]